MYSFRFHVIENITRTSTAINRAFTGMRFHAKQFALGINEGYHEALKLEQEAGRLERAQKRAFDPAGVAGFGISLRGLAGAAAGIFGGIGILDFTQEMSSAQQATEKYSAILGIAFQNANKASMAISGITQFALANRLNIDATTESYISLVNRGFAPSLVQMQSLTDFALSKKKGIDQYVEAILDAETLEFERVKEFGVRLQKTGNNIQATYNGQTKVIGANATAIRQYLLGLGELQGVKGSAAAIAATTGGFLQNIRNQSRQLALGFGAALQPITSTLLPRFGGMLESLVGWVQRNQESITKWASTFVELGVRVLAVWGIFQAYGALTSVFAGVQLAIAGIGSALFQALQFGLTLGAQFGSLALSAIQFGLQAAASTGVAIRAALSYLFSLRLATLSQIQLAASGAWASAVAGFAAMRTGVLSFVSAAVPSIVAFASSLNFAAIGQALLNTLMLANPVGLIIAGILALTAAIYGLFKLTDTLFPGFFQGIKEWFGKAWDFIYNTFIQPLMGFFKWLGNLSGLTTPSLGGTQGTAVTTAGSIAGIQMPSLPGGLGKSQGLGVNSALGNAVEGSRAGVKNITIHIGKQIETLTFHTTNLRESVDVIRREVEKVVLDVANDFNQAK